MARARKAKAVAPADTTAFQRVGKRTARVALIASNMISSGGVSTSGLTDTDTNAKAKACLDVMQYPVILDNILAFCSEGTLATMLTTCRHMFHAAGRHLYANPVFRDQSAVDGFAKDIECQQARTRLQRRTIDFEGTLKRRLIAHTESITYVDPTCVAPLDLMPMPKLKWSVSIRDRDPVGGLPPSDFCSEIHRMFASGYLRGARFRCHGSISAARPITKSATIHSLAFLPEAPKAGMSGAQAPTMDILCRFDSRAEPFAVRILGGLFFTISVASQGKIDLHLWLSDEQDNAGCGPDRASISTVQSDDHSIPRRILLLFAALVESLVREGDGQEPLATIEVVRSHVHFHRFSAPGRFDDPLWWGLEAISAFDQGRGVSLPWARFTEIEIESDEEREDGDEESDEEAGHARRGSSASGVNA